MALQYLCWVPAFTGQLAALGVVDGRVKDGDTEVTILIDVGVPHFGEEADGRRRVRVVRRELDVCLRRREKRRLGRRNKTKKGIKMRWV